MADGHNCLVHYFLLGPKRDRAKQPKIIYKEFKDVLGICYFKGMFALQATESSKLYQAPPNYIIYAEQQPFKGGQKRLQNS